MIEDWGFDGERALTHVRRLCHPRGAGTPGERRAAEYLAGQFKALGLEVRRDPFRVSHFPTAVGSRLIFTACAVLAVLGAYAVSRQPILAVFFWGVAAYLINAPWRGNAWLGGDWPPYAHSANLIASLPTHRNEAPARVIFMAHYDSKSQVVPTAVRVLLVTIATYVCVFLAILGLLAALGITAQGDVIGPWTPTSVVVLALAGLMANVSGNRCPGALNNASAAGALLELARTWRPRLDAPADVLWVATGAKEVNQCGAWHFLATHGHLWQEKPTLLINLECVGAGAKIYLAGQPDALALAQRLAHEMGLPYAQLRVLGAGMDHQPFAARELPSVSIMGDVVRHAFVMHSQRDTLAVVDAAAMTRAGHFASQLAWHWAATAGQGAVRAEAVVPA